MSPSPSRCVLPKRCARMASNTRSWYCRMRSTASSDTRPGCGFTAEPQIFSMPRSAQARRHHPECDLERHSAQNEPRLQRVLRVEEELAPADDVSRSADLGHHRIERTKPGLLDRAHRHGATNETFDRDLP